MCRKWTRPISNGDIPILAPLSIYCSGSAKWEIILFVFVVMVYTLHGQCVYNISSWRIGNSVKAMFTVLVPLRAVCVLVLFFNSLSLFSLSLSLTHTSLCLRKKLLSVSHCARRVHTKDNYIESSFSLRFDRLSVSVGSIYFIRIIIYMPKYEIWFTVWINDDDGYSAARAFTTIATDDGGE